MWYFILVLHHLDLRIKPLDDPISVLSLAEYLSKITELLGARAGKFAGLLLSHLCPNSADNTTQPGEGVETCRRATIPQVSVHLPRVCRHGAIAERRDLKRSRRGRAAKPGTARGVPPEPGRARPTPGPDALMKC